MDVLKKFLFSIVFCLFAAPLAAQIEISVAAPLSGQFASLGKQMRAGAALAVADLNATGGLLGQSIALIENDDRCQAESAKAIANRMAGRQVKLMIGHLCAAASIAASKVYAEAKIIQISPATTNPNFSDERPLKDRGTYRIASRDDQEAETAADFVFQNFSGKSIAIIHDSSNYGNSLATSMRETLAKRGNPVRLFTDFAPGRRNYADLVNEIRSRSIDFLFIAGYFADVALITAEVKAAMPTITIMSGETIATGEFAEIAGPAANGTLMVLPPLHANKSSAAEVTVRLLNNAEQATNYSLAAYSAVMVWATAVRRTNSVDFTTVTDTLNSARFPSPIGTIRFDDKGDATLPGFIVYEWQNGVYDPMRSQ